MKLILITLLACTISIVSAMASNSFQPIPGKSCDISRCNHAPSTPAFKECTNNLYTQEDNKLNNLYKKAIQSDKENELANLNNTKYKQKLKTIQKYWIAFRDYQCLLESEIYAPDSAKEYFCLCEITQERNQDLQRIISY